MMDIPNWWMKGDWFDLCNCDAGCPCTFEQLPTYKRCEGVMAYHIREGAYGDLRLDGLNVVIVDTFEGIPSPENPIQIGVFIDEHADERQRAVLQQVFLGQAGGWMGLFAQLIGEVKGVAFVPISIEVAEDLGHWRVEIPDKVTGAAEALTGFTTPPGTRVQLHNAPGSEVGPGQVMTFAKSKAATVDAFGFRWGWAGQSSKHAPFDWTGPEDG